jgi:hypothetical protein
MAKGTEILADTQWYVGVMNVDCHFYLV